jgi:CoA:oxalate CoA-transferase
MEALGPERANVPCSPVYTVDQLLDHPQLRAREMIVTLAHAQLGAVKVPGVPVKLSDTPGAVRRLGPELGEHNAEIYEGLLGLDAAEVARLRASAII